MKFNQKDPRGNNFSLESINKSTNFSLEMCQSLEKGDSDHGINQSLEKGDSDHGINQSLEKGDSDHGRPQRVTS
jgi:hypothetical protein